MTPAGYYYAAHNVFTAEHGGTHIDAPVHFAAKHSSVDAIPLERLMGPAVVVDVTEASDRVPDYQIVAADVARWESDHGAIPAGAIVLFRRWRSCTFPGCIPTRRAG
jgi:kynurenine formamidase